MKRLLSTCLFLLLVSVTAPQYAAAQDEDEKAFYRVEVIVFTQAGGRSDAWPVEALADHSEARDPAWRAFAEARIKRQADEKPDGAADLSDALDVVEAISSIERGESSLAEILLYPDPWRALPSLSEPMERVLSRLEASGTHRVITSLAWYQPLEAGAGERVRIHDDQVIAAEWISLTPHGQLRRDGRPALRARDLAPDFHYRLDGTLRLRQRQFMHADIDLHWREPDRVISGLFPVRAPEARFDTHRLEQSRTIRSERLEYFDSDWIGVTLLATPFEPESAESDEAEDSAQTR